MKSVQVIFTRFLSLWYDDFSPTSDEQVSHLLAQNVGQLEKLKFQDQTTISK